MRFKSEIDALLGVSKRRRQRLCEKHYTELSLLGFERGSKFINDDCFEFLKSKVLKKRTIHVLRNKVAEKFGISPKTFSRWMKNNPEVLNKLKSTGFQPKNNGFTKDQYDIVKEGWGHDKGSQLEDDVLEAK